MSRSCIRTRQDTGLVTTIIKELKKEIEYRTGMGEVGLANKIKEILDEIEKLKEAWDNYKATDGIDREAGFTDSILVAYAGNKPIPGLFSKEMGETGQLLPLDFYEQALGNKPGNDIWPGDEKVLTEDDYGKIMAMKYIYGLTDDIRIKDAAHKQAADIRNSYGRNYIDDYKYSTNNFTAPEISFNFKKLTSADADLLSGIAVDAVMEATGDVQSIVVKFFLNILLSAVEKVPAEGGDLEVNMIKRSGSEYEITDFYFRKETNEMYHKTVWPVVDVPGGSLVR